MCGQGRKRVIDFRTKADPIMQLLAYETLACACIYKDTHTAIVIMTAQVHKKGSAGITVRLTMVWRETVKGARLVHLHVSIPMLVNGAIGAQSIASLSAGTAEAAGPAADPPLIMKDSDGKTHVVVTSKATYLEAQHQYTMVHTLTQKFRVRESLTTALERFPAYIVRVHRSYAVNAFMVDAVGKAEVELRDGTHIPLPAKRSAAARTLILDAISQSLAGASTIDLGNIEDAPVSSSSPLAQFSQDGRPRA